MTFGARLDSDGGSVPVEGQGYCDDDSMVGGRRIALLGKRQRLDDANEGLELGVGRFGNVECQLRWRLGKGGRWLSEEGASVQLRRPGSV
ncbi:hypothetical protein V6N13_076252 [Hibiscus sabdariffa]